METSTQVIVSLLFHRHPRDSAGLLPATCIWRVQPWDSNSSEPQGFLQGMLTQVLEAICIASLTAVLARASRTSACTSPLLILDLKDEAADHDNVALLEKLQQSFNALTKPVSDT